MNDQEIEKVIKDIKALRIQGNTNIAKAAVKAILDYITNAKVNNYQELLSKVKYYCNELANARPNEPLLYNAISFILNDIEDATTQQQARVRVIDRIQSFFSYIDESFALIKENAFQILRSYRVFMTHCHSSLVREVLIRIHESSGYKLTVINTETRPLYQGRIMALKLSEAGVKVIHIVDSAASSFLLDPRYPKPEVIVVGSDGITVKGDLINKVGTLGIAIVAKMAKIPFYVVTQTLKLDLRSMKPNFVIEMRDPSEVWEPNASELNTAKMEIINPAFDVVPSKYITGGYITEKGLLEPADFRTMVEV